MRAQQGRGGRRGWQQAEVPSAEDAAGWFAGRLPDGWFTGPADVTIDRDEILVVGTLPAVEVEGDSADVIPSAEAPGGSADAIPSAEAPGRAAAAEAGRIDRFREETREERMTIAQQAQHRYGRAVSWGAACGGSRGVFTTQAVPVMTRLRQAERQVLDTLVDSGVARSRSEALAWSVRLVGEHAEQWLADLKRAMTDVDRLRAEGPDLS